MVGDDLERRMLVEGRASERRVVDDVEVARVRSEGLDDRRQHGTVKWIEQVDDRRAAR